eukprot:GHVS01066525.1.p1 GENE.GHVS01066525.1~~GHVS01066525.1.p1  ORF type:complete len:278 (+),score=39.51 GHVS01066525.1:43-876(+)
MQQEGYPVNVGVTAVTLFSLLVVCLSLGCCQAAAPLRYLGSDIHTNNEFLSKALNLKVRRLDIEKVEEPLWNGMEEHEVLNLMNGAKVYGLSSHGPRRITRDGKPVAFEETFEGGDTAAFKKKMQEGSTVDVGVLDRALSKVIEILNDLKESRVKALSFCPNQELESSLKEPEIVIAHDLLSQASNMMGTIEGPESADGSLARNALAKAFKTRTAVSLGFCLGLPVMAFKREGKENGHATIEADIKDALDHDGNAEYVLCNRGGEYIHYLIWHAGRS